MWQNAPACGASQPVFTCSLQRVYSFSFLTEVTPPLSVSGPDWDLKMVLIYKSEIHEKRKCDVRRKCYIDGRILLS